MVTFFLIIIYLAFISLGLPDSLLGSAWPVMRLEFEAPIESAGLLFMVIAAGTIVSSLMSGMVINRYGTGKVTLVSCILTAGALLGFAYVPSFEWLFVCAIPLGLGAGSVDAGLNNYVAANYKAHHMSWLHCFWGVGATLGPMIMAQFLLGQNQWRYGYLTVSFIQFALVVILALTLPLWKRVEQKQEIISQENYEEVEENNPTSTKPWSIKGVKLAMLTFFFFCGVESTVGLWGSSFLVNVKDLPAAVAAGWVSLYYGGITVGRFITGFITFRVSNRMLIRGGQTIALGGAVLLLLPLPSVFSLIGFVIIGLGLAPIFPCMLHETPVRFGKKHSQSIMGYQMAMAYTGTTLIPPLFGFLASNITISIFPFYVVGCALAMFLFSEKLNSLMRRKSESLLENIN